MRIEQITFTRFIAAVAIVIFHFGKSIFPFNFQGLSFIVEQANIGVSYFFILSGFIMIIAYSQKNKINTWDYLKNRFARIYPVYFLAIFLFLLIGVVFHSSIDYKGLFLNVFLIQSWFPGYALSFNTAGWSLAVELLFYLSFPILYNRIYTKITLKKIAFPVIFFWIISQLILQLLWTSNFYKGFPSNSHDLLFYFPLMHLNQFLIGNLAGLYYVKYFKEKKMNLDWLIISLLFLLILILKYNSLLNFHNGFLMVIFIPLIYAFAINDGLFSRISNLKGSIFLGEISFGIYILQFPIFKLSKIIAPYLGIESKIAIFYFSIFMLILFSSISYLYFETPLRNKIKKIKFSL